MKTCGLLGKMACSYVYCSVCGGEGGVMSLNLEFSAPPMITSIKQIENGKIQTSKGMLHLFLYWGKIIHHEIVHKKI